MSLFLLLNIAWRLPALQPQRERRPPALLFDNGSVRPAAARGLQELARQLSLRLGVDVVPCSLRPYAASGAAVLSLDAAVQARTGEAPVLLPLFIAPSQQLQDVRRKHPQLPMAPPLVGWLPGLTQTDTQPDIVARTEDSGMAQVVGILEAHVRQVRSTHGRAGEPSIVIVCDHGSPSPAVTAVRNRLADGLRQRLPAEEYAHVVAASMERRPGPEYAFNEPLLENVIEAASLPQRGLAIVALAFLLPGRHAGPGGDVERILGRLRQRYPDLQPVVTPLLAAHEKAIELLASNYETICAGLE